MTMQSPSNYLCFKFKFKVTDLVNSIHTFMIPIAGAFFVILGIILIVLVEKKKDKFTQQIPLIYLALIIIQMVNTKKKHKINKKLI